MKNLFKTMVAVLAIGSLFISSCKKGENDPFLSLKSRKARLVGEWKLTSGTVKTTNTSGSSSTTTTQTFTETAMTQTTVSGSSTTTDDYTITEYSLTFEKEGTYSMKTVATQTTSNGTAIPASFQVVTTQDSKGHWVFMGKNKDLDQKKKEGIAYTPSSETTSSATQSGTTTSSDTYTGWNTGTVWMIDQLKNKEIVFKGSYSDSDNNGSSTTEYTYTFSVK